VPSAELALVVSRMKRICAHEVLMLKDTHENSLSHALSHQAIVRMTALCITIMYVVVYPPITSVTMQQILQGD